MFLDGGFDFVAVTLLDQGINDKRLVPFGDLVADQGVSALAFERAEDIGFDRLPAGRVLPALLVG